MTNEPQTGAELTYFLYRSTARDNLSQDDLEQIVAEARARNQDLSLTGCLHHEDGLFFQWLEGPKHALDTVIALIRQDPRHLDMTELSYGPLPGRHFGEWTMRSTDRDKASLLDWFATQKVSTIDRGAYAGSVSAFLMAISI